MSRTSRIETDRGSDSKGSLPAEGEQGKIEHELANLLTAIALYSEQAMKRLKEDDPLYQDLQQILLASEQAVALTQK